jgi:hypothetical protein
VDKKLLGWSGKVEDKRGGWSPCLFFTCFRWRKIRVVVGLGVQLTLFFLYLYSYLSCLLL